MKKLFLMSVVFASASAAFASGFGLYEPTAIGTAYGGALVGKGLDGSANSINPATLDDITNLTVQVGFVTEHPRGRIKITKATSGFLNVSVRLEGETEPFSEVAIELQ